jgi:hypothetical protein
MLFSIYYLLSIISVFHSQFSFLFLSLYFRNDPHPSVRNDPEHISPYAITDGGLLLSYYPGYRSFVA